MPSAGPTRWTRAAGAARLQPLGGRLRFKTGLVLPSPPIERL